MARRGRSTRCAFLVVLAMAIVASGMTPAGVPDADGDGLDRTYLNPTVSADGRWLFYQADRPSDSHWDLHRHDVESGSTQRVTGLAACYLGNIQSRPTADGSAILFNSSADCTGRNPDGNSEVFLIEFDQPSVLRLSGDPTLLAWDPEPTALTYDLIRGDLAALQGGDGAVNLGAVSCVENDTRSAVAADRPDPVPGNGFFYLMRSDEGTYGLYSDGRPRVTASGDCSF